MFASLVLLMVALTALALSDARPARVHSQSRSLPRSAADGALAVARARLLRGEIDYHDFDRIARVLRD